MCLLCQCQCPPSLSYACEAQVASSMLLIAALRLTVLLPRVRIFGSYDILRSWREPAKGPVSLPEVHAARSVRLGACCSSRNRALQRRCLPPAAGWDRDPEPEPEQGRARVTVTGRSLSDSEPSLGRGCCHCQLQLQTGPGHLGRRGQCAGAAGGSDLRLPSLRLSAGPAGGRVPVTVPSSPSAQVNRRPRGLQSED